MMPPGPPPPMAPPPPPPPPVPPPGPPIPPPQGAAPGTGLPTPGPTLDLPKTRRRRFQQHEDEDILDAVTEIFQIDRELNRQFATVNGRPMFTLPLSDEEKWARWQDPTQRAEIIRQITQREGPDEVPKYVKHMADVDKRLHGGGRGTATGGTVAPSAGPPPARGY